VIAASTLAVCVALLFVPHHEKGPSSFGNTMYSLLRQSVNVIAEGPPAASMAVAAGMLALVFTAFYPVLFVTMLRLTGSRWPFFLGGILAGLGAAGGFLAMTLSQAPINFSGSGSAPPGTPFLWLIPAIQGACAVASVVAGFSKRFI
jgi:hypothetical protein